MRLTMSLAFLGTRSSSTKTLPVVASVMEKSKSRPAPVANDIFFFSAMRSFRSPSLHTVPAIGMVSNVLEFANLKETLMGNGGGKRNLRKGSLDQRSTEEMRMQL